jgi:type IV secretion system protein VirD4
MGKFEDWVENEAQRRGVPGRPELPAAAEWLDASTLAKGGWEFEKDRKVNGLFLGRWAGRDYGWTDDRHVLTVAGSRAGKGTSLIIPNLLQYEGSVVAIDPKGELAAITAEHRRTKLGQRVVVLDPFGVSRVPPGSYNPLDAIELSSDDAMDDALAISEAMIQIPSTEPHWAESAQAVVQALILLVKLFREEDGRNLASVHDLLMLSHRRLQRYASANYLEENYTKALFSMMVHEGRAIAEEHEEISALLEGVGQTYGMMADKERESVLSAARTQTRFLRSPALRRCLGRSVLGMGEAREEPWSLGDIKRRPMTVYLCLPAKRMASHAKWLRIVINLCLQSFEDLRVPVDIPVLMVLDEFNVLGHMETIEKAAGQVAGFGVKLWTILQDVGQIEKLYEKSWETFVGNAGVVTFFGNADVKTLDYISRKLGTRAFLTARPSNRTADQGYGGVPDNRQELRQEPLMATHEIAEALGRGKKSILVIAAERKPVLLERAVYYDASDRFYKLWKGA